MTTKRDGNDQLRPRRTERRHHSRRGGARGGCARARVRLAAGPVLRHRQGAPRPLRVDRRAARRRRLAGDGHERIDGGGGAALPHPRRRGRPRGRRTADLRPNAAAAEPAGAELAPAPLEADGVDVDAVAAACEAGGAEARPRHPQLPQPGGLHALGREAPASGRARRRARLRAVRGRPLPPDQLRGEGRRDDAGDGRRGPRHPRLLVLEDGQPRRARRLPGRPRRADRDPLQARERELHLAQHARRVRRLGALPLRRPRRRTSRW